MVFAGFEPVSLVDYPGEVASVLFTQGCNLNCEYCHNKELIPVKIPEQNLSEQSVIQRIKHNFPKVRHLVITGGEPGVHTKALREFLSELKRELPTINIKVDTNGTIPGFLEGLTAIANYIALDYKGPLFPYGDRFKTWKHSLHLLELFQGSEIRLTVYPKYFPNDSSRWAGIGNLLRGKTVVLQQYQQVEGTENVYPYLEDTLLVARRVLNRYAKKVIYRGGEDSLAS